MSTLTIRLPDDKHERLKALARANSISVNKLIDELATVALANYDARVRFEIRAGGVTRLPATDSIPTYAVKIEDGMVCVAEPELY